MKTNGYNRFVPVVLALAAAGFGGGGCTTLFQNDQQQAEYMSLREDFRSLKLQLNALDARIQGLEIENQHLREALTQMQNRTSPEAAAIRALQGDLQEVKSQVRALDAARSKDRQEIVDSLSGKISTIMRAAGGGSSSSGSSNVRRTSASSGSQAGYEHVVQAGESLSAIAAAYKVKIAAILEANGMTNADKLPVGKKLFIPKP